MNIFKSPIKTYTSERVRLISEIMSKNVQFIFFIDYNLAEFIIFAPSDFEYNKIVIRVNGKYKRRYFMFFKYKSIKSGNEYLKLEKRPCLHRGLEFTKSVDGSTIILSESSRVNEGLVRYLINSCKYTELYYKPVEEKLYELSNI